MDIHNSYKRDSEETHDDFFKFVSHNISVANFRPIFTLDTDDENSMEKLDTNCHIHQTRISFLEMSKIVSS